MRNETVILGGGIAGLGVAAELARRGIRATVVERGEHLGGHAANWACMATDHCQRCGVCLVHDTLRSVGRSQTVTPLTRREVTAVQGEAGRFRIRTRGVGDDAGATTEETLEADSVVLALGFAPFDPRQAGRPLGYGTLPQVVTTVDLNQALRRDRLDALGFTGGEAKHLAVLQCVGSRDPAAGRGYCSQICCGAALRLSRRLLHARPDWRLTIFYIDLQVYGKGARREFASLPASIKLVQGVPGEIRDRGEEGITVVFQAADGNTTLQRFDGALLAVGLQPRPETTALAGALGFTDTAMGFMAPASRPAGVWAAGACLGPTSIEGCLVQAHQVAAEILTAQAQGRSAWPGLSLPDGAERSLAEPSRTPPPPVDVPVTRAVAVFGTGPEAEAVCRALEETDLKVERIREPSGATLTGTVGAFAIKTPAGRKPIRVGAVVIATGVILDHQLGAEWLDFPVCSLADWASFADQPGSGGETAVDHAVEAIWLDPAGPAWRPAARALLETAARLGNERGPLALICQHVALPGLDAQKLYDQARAAGLHVIRQMGDALAPAPGERPPTLIVRDAAVPEVDARLTVSRLVVVGVPVPPSRPLRQLGLDTDREGFAQRETIRLVPHRTGRAGVFVLGSVRQECLAAELAAETAGLAAEIRSLLHAEQLSWLAAPVAISRQWCVRCQSCVRTCPHGAIQPQASGPPVISDLACQACGQCRAICPSTAIQAVGVAPPLRSPTPDRPPTIIYACRNSGFHGLRERLAEVFSQPERVHVQELPCGSALSEEQLLDDLTWGTLRVVVVTCHRDSCAHLDGDRRCLLRVLRTGELLTKLGFPADTLHHLPAAPAESARLSRALQRLLATGGTP